MKMLLLLLLLLPMKASATPYFRVIGKPGYERQILNEACFDPLGGIGATTNCTSIPLVEHRHQDGYILIPNEDWAITVGGAFGAGSPLLVFGPAANLTPVMRNFALSALNATTDSGSFLNLKSMLAPSIDSTGPDLTINLGLKYGVLPTQKFKGVFIASIGPAFTF